MKDNYISSTLDTANTLMHAKWSEEAKERVRQARKAGRSVYDMFSSSYNKASKEGSKIIRRASKDGSKLVKRVSRDGSRFISNTSKEGSKLVKRVSREGSKVISNTSRAGQKTLKTIDRSITRAVNKRDVAKDRKTVTSKERKQIAKEYAKARKTNQKKLDLENRRLNSPGKKFVANITGRGTEYTIQKEMKKKANQKRNDARNAKSLEKARENTVTKNKYKSVGDMIDKNVNKVKKGTNKQLSNLGKSVKKTKSDFDYTLHKTKNPAKTTYAKNNKDGSTTYVDEVDRGFLGRTRSEMTVGTPRKKSSKSKKSTKSKKLKQSALDPNNIIII